MFHFRSPFTQKMAYYISSSVLSIFSVSISWKSFDTSSEKTPLFCFLGFLHTAAQYSIACIYHILFNPSPMLGDIGSFQYFTITNNAAVNNFVHIYFHTVGGAPSG